MTEKPEPMFDDSPAEDSQMRDFQRVFEECQNGLRAFLVGRLSQVSDVDDCLQAVFIKMMSRGDTVSPAARRAWLFRVASNQAALLWRQSAIRQRALENKTFHDPDCSSHFESDPADQISDRETVDRIGRSIKQLPINWQRIIELRIGHDKTFQQIADELNIPLGTALTQMRRALQAIRDDIGE